MTKYDENEMEVRAQLSNVLDNLLVYKIAAKILSKKEIDVILDEGGKNFIQYTNFDSKTMNSIVNDVIRTKKQLILLGAQNE